MAIFIKDNGCDSGDCGDDPCSCIPVITSAVIVEGNICTSIYYQTTATNSPTSYSYTGTLPSGVSFDTSTGELTGTPSEEWDDVIYITATNSCGDSVPFSLEIFVFKCNLFVGSAHANGNAYVTEVDSWLVTDQFANCSNDVKLDYNIIYSDSSVTVLGDSFVLYSSGCIAPGSYSATFTVPSGTDYLDVSIELGCASPSPATVGYDLYCI